MNTAAGIAAFLIFAAMIITICASIHISIRHLERIESLLPSSSFVNGNKETFSQAGLYGKILRTLLISILLTAPRIYARKGLVNLEEVQNFPAKIRSRLILLGAMHPILMGCLILLCIWL